MEDQQQENHGKLLLTGISTVVIIVFVVLIGIAIVVLRTRNQEAPSISQPAPTSFVAVGKGELSLVEATNQTTFSVGSTITVDVLLSSDNNSVTAYDIELLFGPEVSFISAESLLPSYGMSSSKKDSGVYITGYRKVGDEQNNAFTKTPVARLTFRMMKPGSTTIAPQFIPGQKTHSNIITSENTNVLGKVEGITLEVK